MALQKYVNMPVCSLVKSSVTCLMSTAMQTSKAVYDFHGIIGVLSFKMF